MHIMEYKHILTQYNTYPRDDKEDENNEINGQLDDQTSSTEIILSDEQTIERNEQSEYEMAIECVIEYRE